MTTNLYRVLPAALKGRFRMSLMATSCFNQHMVNEILRNIFVLMKTNFIRLD